MQSKNRLLHNGMDISVPVYMSLHAICTKLQHPGGISVAKQESLQHVRATIKRISTKRS